MLSVRSSHLGALPRTLAIAAVVLGGLMAAPAAHAEGILDSGMYHACAVKADGAPECWGWNDWKQTTLPEDIGTVSSISAGEIHSCAVKTDGTPVCWGTGYGAADQTAVPAGIGRVLSISAGSTVTCAIRVDYTPVCWGDDAHGIVSGAELYWPAESVSVGKTHACVVKRNQTRYCWGRNEFGELTLPAGIGAVSSIVAGETHSCAVKTDGTPLCWGGWRGEGTLPSNLGTVSEIAAGWNHSCAVKTGGTPVCWPATDYAESPPDHIDNVSGVTVGWDHSCAIKADGTPACWGANFYGAADVPPSVGKLGPPPPPQMSVRPSVSAVTWTSGTTVAADRGEWTNEPTAYHYAWYRCGTGGGGCVAITGDQDDDAGYALSGADDGHTIRVKVTAVNAGGSLERFSYPSPVVGVPVMVDRPSVSGRTRTGDELTADPGVWSPAPTGHDVEWLRCPTVYLDRCARITSPDATDGNLRYTLVDEDDGKRIRVRVTARNAAGGSIPRPSNPTAVIDLPALLERPRVSGTPAAGQLLTTTTGDWSGRPSGYTVEWVRCTTIYLNSCTRIAGADAITYEATADDAGRRIRSRVAARNAAGAGPKATSLHTAKVAGS